MLRADCAVVRVPSPIRLMASAIVVLGLGMATQCRGAELGGVHGRVTLAVEGATIAEARPLIVFLDAVKGALDYRVPTEVPKISQRDATFSPDFLVVAARQRVELPNDDLIVHNVFSASKPNQLDLGLYPKGESKTVAFDHPGAVSVYCSIHESMNALIFVAPSPYHSEVGTAGTFTIADVPPGTYRLRTWSPMLPEASGEVTVVARKFTEAALSIAERTDHVSGATPVR
jgi:plastocyanin